MKKTALATAVALSLGISAAAEANTSGLTGVWTGSYTFSMFSPGGGPVGAPTAPQAWTWDFDAGSVTIANTTTFYASVWTAHDVTITDNGTSYGPNGGQGVVNMLFDWSANTNIDVVNVWNVVENAGVVHYLPSDWDGDGLLDVVFSGDNNGIVYINSACGLNQDTSLTLTQSKYTVTNRLSKLLSVTMNMGMKDRKTSCSLLPALC